MRLIDADAYEYPGDLINEPTITLDDIIPHGRWEEYPDSAHLRCTHCKIEFKKEKMTDTKNYCPVCGAKMDLEVNNG